MGKDELARNYLSRFRMFEGELHLSRLLELASGVALHGFPWRMPEPLASQLLGDVGKLLSAYKAAIDGAPEEGPIPGFMLDLEHEWSSHIVRWFIGEGEALRGKNPETLPPLDIANLLPARARAQALVMFYAHLDAFIGDTMGAICEAEPRVLAAGGRTISWGDVVKADSREALLHGFAEEYLRKFDREKLKTRLDRIENTGVELSQLASADREFLLSAEQVRHDIVHAGSRASAGSAEVLCVAVGEAFEVSSEFTSRCFDVVVTTAQAIYAGVVAHHMAVT